MHKTVALAISQGIIRYEDTPKGRCVVYIQCGHRKQPVGNAEEWVRLMAYLQLILRSGYPPERVAVEFPIKMGSSYRYADIVVFEDNEQQKPFIVVECKREEATPKIIEEGIKQGQSYMKQAGGQYLWVTSGEHGSNYFFEYDNTRFYAIHALPEFGTQQQIGYILRKKIAAIWARLRE